MARVTEESVRRLLAEERDKIRLELRELLRAELGLLERRVQALEEPGTRTSQVDDHFLKATAASVQTPRSSAAAGPLSSAAEGAGCRGPAGSVRALAGCGEAAESCASSVGNSADSSSPEFFDCPRFFEAFSQEPRALGSSTGRHHALQYFALGADESQNAAKFQALRPSQDAPSRQGPDDDDDDDCVEMPYSIFIWFLFKVRQGAQNGTRMWPWILALSADVAVKSLLAWSYSDDFQRPLDAIMYQHTQHTVDFSCFYQTTLVQTAHQTVPRITLLQGALCFLVMACLLQKDDTFFMVASPRFVEMGMLKRIILSTAWCTRVVYMPLVLAKGAALSMSFMRNPSELIVESVASIFIVDLDELMFNVLVPSAEKKVYQRDAPSLPGFAVGRGSVHTVMFLKAVTLVFMFACATAHLTMEPWAESSYLTTWGIFFLAIQIRSLLFAQYHERNYELSDDFQGAFWRLYRYGRYVLMVWVALIPLAIATLPTRADSDMFQKFDELSSCIAEQGQDCRCEDVHTTGSDHGLYMVLALLR